jgi:hypothetical protein
MRLRRRKSKPEELFEPISRSLSTLGDSVGTKTAVKAAIITGGVAALTAASAAVSSLRRRTQVGA